MDRNDLARWANVGPGYWFAPKLYGWGATPVTWQGWVATIGFVAAIIALQTVTNEAIRIMSSVILIAIFLVIIWKKTDGGWKWRWGEVD